MNYEPEHVIRPPAPWPKIPLDELWRFRELIYFLAWRDVKVRYKQTALGVAWAVIQPFASMVIFWIFLGRLAHVPSDGLPYPLFAFAALVIWQLFALTLTESGASVVANERLITKVYFPRLVIPLSTIGAALLDFAIGLVLLIIMMGVYRVIPGIQVIWLPAFILLAVVAAFGVGTLFSALNVRYRDVRYTLTFLAQIWLFATPVAYPASLVPPRWLPLYGLNPMVGVVEGFRWCLLNGPPPSMRLVAASAFGAVAFVFIGALYFRRTEQLFADYL